MYTRTYIYICMYRERERDKNQQPQVLGPTPIKAIRITRRIIAPGTGRKLGCCCFSHSAYWLPTRKKLPYTGANPARGLLNRGLKKKKSGGISPPARAARSEGGFITRSNPPKYYKGEAGKWKIVSWVEEVKSVPGRESVCSVCADRGYLENSQGI